jgi:CheY-like chemotaxis protein
MDHGVVLIVDPDRAARQRSELVLARAGLSVVSTADGTGALRMVSRVQPDEVLTEIVLPTIDGFHLARRLRAEERTRDIGIVALTDYDGEDLQQRAAESGIDRVVRKSWGTAVLVRAVRSTLRAAVDARQRLADQRTNLHSEVTRHQDLRAQLRDMTTELHEIREQIETTFGLSVPHEPADGMLAEADGARGVMLVDRQRGEQLFRVLLESHPDQPLLYFKRGEAYRAMGRRKLAHEDFVKAFEFFPDGPWRQRAKIAAMRTRSHHEPGW